MPADDAIAEVFDALCQKAAGMADGEPMNCTCRMYNNTPIQSMTIVHNGVTMRIKIMVYEERKA